MIACTVVFINSSFHLPFSAVKRVLSPLQTFWFFFPTGLKLPKYIYIFHKYNVNDFALQRDI